MAVAVIFSHHVVSRQSNVRLCLMYLYGLKRGTLLHLLLYAYSPSLAPFWQSLPHTFCHFRHSSKYPVGPSCGLPVLAYLALGSIQLQVEASHSSQSHKMWLVLTTALRGDGLIGLIGSDRACWTLRRKTRRNSMLRIHPNFAFFCTPIYSIFCRLHRPHSLTHCSLCSCTAPLHCLGCCYLRLTRLSVKNDITNVRIYCQCFQFYLHLIQQSHI